MTMGWWGVGLAIGLPWLTGTLWISGGRRGDGVPGGGAVAMGYGYVLGLLVVTLLLRAQAALGWRLDATAPLVIMALVALAGGWRIWRQVTVHTPHPGPLLPRGRGASRWQWLLFALLLGWLGWRFVILAQEIWLRPLYPWDAWTTWAVRPRVWSEWRELIPFVAPQLWLADPTGSAYTIEAWAYPWTVPLLALWPTLALGAWNETAANLPWLGAALALGFGFYGQARWWGASPLIALIFTWLLLSLPLLDTHIALAGYADFWLATVFGLAVIAFWQWARTGDRRQGVLAVLLALACPLLKLEGAVWLMLFIPALLTVGLRGWPLRIFAAAVAILGVGWWAVGGVAFTLPGWGAFSLTPTLIQVPSLGTFNLGYRGSWDPVLNNFFVLSNWHLFWYLALIGVGLVVVRWPVERWQHAQLVLMVASLAALFVLFFMTDAQRWAEYYTSINRVFFEFIPAFLFWVLTVLVPPRSTGRAGQRLLVALDHGGSDRPDPELLL
ncbi:MAG: hypothetical protein LAE24_03790 [Candidatus Contendobacter sp.]|nr:hypothetical protein [Candidatus Contendobacter sp.]